MTWCLVADPTDCNFGDCVHAESYCDGMLIDIWSTRRSSDDDFVTVERDEWDAFRAAVKRGEFDDV